jgi:hypothetical protein
LLWKASWVGMSPGNNESLGINSGRIYHRKNKKRIQTEAVSAATRANNTFCSAQYHRLASRRDKKEPSYQ